MMPEKPTYEALEKRVAELEESKMFLENLLNMIPELVSYIDKNHTFKFGNSAYRKFFNIEPNSMTGSHPREVLGEEAFKEVESRHKAALSGQEQKYESNLLLPNGARCYFHAHYLPYMENEQVKGFLAVVQDITDRKQAEDKLRLSEERYRLLFENADVLVSVYDRNGICQLMNRKLASLFGGVPGDYVNKSFEALHPVEGKEYTRRVKEVIDSGVTKDYEDEVQFPEGKRWLFSRVHPVKNSLGTIIAAQIISQDITDRKKAENELKQSEARFRELAELLPETIFEVDVTGNITFVNHKAFQQFKYTQQDFANGLNAFDMIAPDDRDRAVENITKILEGSDIGLSEYKALRKDGTTFPALLHSSVILHAEKPAGLRGFIIDVTEKKQLEAHLSQSQKMESIGTLAGGIAHDFNNILSSIIGFTELALDETKKGTPLEDSLQEVYSAGKRAKDLVKQILAFARQSDEKIGPFKPSTVAKEVLTFIRSAIPTSIEIQQKIESEALILGNATQVHQVLMNLCTNAAHAMEDSSGVLSVRLKDVFLNEKDFLARMKPGDYVEIKVADTGVGIAPENINSIFEPYFTTKEPGEGTGLGLAMVQGVIESYGGKITVDSQLGKGTTFTIHLPITKKLSAQDTYVPEELPTGSEHILFVDDEAPIAKMGAQILERLGYTVTTRTSSIEALELFRAKPNDFDLVVTDMTMPNMTGDKLAVALQKIQADIPVILCTGYSKKISDETASAIGIKAFAYKPVVRADLAKTVRKVLDAAKG